MALTDEQKRQRREYNKSPAGREALKRYALSPAGRERAKRSTEKYRATAKGQATYRKWLASPAGRESIRRRKEKYRNSEAWQAKKRTSWLRQKYGISDSEYARMFKAQNGACSICETLNLEGKGLFVDHDHATKKVRALLCRACNSLLGYARDKILTLYRAADYLERHSRNKVLTNPQ